jgi:hypothetical protein
MDDQDITHPGLFLFGDKPMYPENLLQALRTAMTTADPGSFLEACDDAADIVLKRLREKKRRPQTDSQERAARDAARPHP